MRTVFYKRLIGLNVLKLSWDSNDSKVLHHCCTATVGSIRTILTEITVI